MSIRFRPRRPGWHYLVGIGLTVWATWITVGQFRPKVEVTKVTMIEQIDKSTRLELLIGDGTQRRVIARYLALPDFGRVARR